MSNKGTYCLCIQLSKNKNITIGALGLIHFNTGNYVYVGSALNSLKPRLIRHLKTSKGINDVLFWHIDYLLNTPEAEIISIYYIKCDQHIECQISNKIAQKGSPVHGFGSSDCKCKSHLYKVDKFEFLKKIGLEKLEINT